MDVSSSTNTNAGSTQINVMKKAMKVQEQNVLKVLESAQQQSQQMAAQKTGIGGNLNITA